MTGAPHDDTLPQHVEDEVLRILDGDEGRRDDALRELLRRESRHARTIRGWLGSCGITIPATTHGEPPREPALQDADTLPMRLGVYVLQEILGRGGFGTVYRAEQQEPIRRPVAVKVLNPGMDSREILGRFTAEREALNRMDHSGIARLLDAGATPKGRPYFVMELVSGPTLVAWCRQRRAPVRERLRLFLMVLDAMQHAHQKAVLHRDLSSNNVLVADPDGNPQPKIIDFGIAKSLNDPLLKGGAMTFQGTLMGTPEFMSPEQAAGRVEDIDTRTDVYALGVQLYELLTDQLPIPGVVLRARGLAGMATVIAEHRHAPPSAAAPRERRFALRGDLDGIAGKALAKSRDERYGTVGEFAADLRRHLADEPVQVATPTTWYRLRKFVRRNRAQSAAVALAAVALLTAIGGLAWGLHIAHASLDEVQRQKDEVTAKADAGFRLLANEERLATAMSAAAALPPPWPENESAFTSWLDGQAAPLVAEVDKVDERLRGLAAKKAGSPGGRFTDPVDEHLENALVRLREALRAFAAPGGPHARIAADLRFLRDVARPAAKTTEAEWKQTLAAITTSDGLGASTAYRGMRMRPLPGLVPLGCDRTTMLCEFLDLYTHTPGHPWPSRDPATGKLRADADTGIVFVLVPAGILRLGTRRGDPGMAGNDDDADDDELGGELVSLDEFLIASTELTRRQWARLGGETVDGDPRLPAVGIAWTEAVATLARAGLHLPTEAQWEFACRAGTDTPWCTGRDPLGVAAQGWFGGRPQRTGALAPNPFGLYDVHGNVAEWCADEKLAYGQGTLRAGDGLRQRAGTPPNAPRAVRGGSCVDSPLAARSTARTGLPASSRDSGVGLRPVRRVR